MSDEQNNLQEEQELPRGWVQVNLDEITYINPSVPNLFGLPDSHPVSFIPMQAVEEITGKMSTNDVRPLSAVRRGYTGFIDGDLIFAKITPSMENGKTAIAKGLFNGIGFGSTEFHVIRPTQGLDAQYLFYYLIRESFRSNAQRSMTGSAGQLRVPTEYLRQTLLPFPSLNEQKRIVEKLKSLLTTIDDAVAGLEQAKEDLKTYRQMILKAAVEGELTREWREEQAGGIEDAEVLLGRILQERRERWEAEQEAKGRKNAKYEEPKAPDIYNLPELPEGWVWASLAQLSWSSSYGTSEKTDYNFNGMPVLRIPNIQNGKINLEDIKFATENAKINPKSTLEVGDLLIIRTNGSRDLIGRASVILDDLGKDFYFASYLIRFRLAEDFLLHQWVNSIWSSEPFRIWIEEKAASTAGQYNISMSVLETLLVPIPPSTEQKQITQEIESRLASADELESSIDAQLKQGAELRQAVLQQAFEGKLVPQDPNDEPASVLLERIREEKERMAKEAKENRRKAPRKAAPKEPGSLVEVLKESKEPHTPEELFRASGYDFSTVETFYTKLKEAVGQNSSSRGAKNP